MAETKNVNTIGRDYTNWELIKFVSSSVITNFVMSLLQNIDDGLFLSRFVGQDALAAFNLCFPIFMLIDAFAMMMCSISTYCATKMGEGRNKEANSVFTTITICMYAIGLMITFVMIFALEPLMRFLGVTDRLFPYAWNFFSVSRWYVPLNMASYIFSRFYVIAGKPKYTTFTMLMSAACNFFFDWLFMVKMQMGIRGSALANLIAMTAVNLFGLVFYFSDKAEIHFAKPAKNVLYLLGTTVRFGFADLTTSLAIALNAFLSNQVILDLGGEMLISAYSIFNGVQFSFSNGFFGLMGASSPLVSYAYGEKNKTKLVKVIKQILLLSGILLLIIFGIYFFGKDYYLMLYLTGKESGEYRDLIYQGLSYAPYCYPFMFFNVYVQVMFMAVSRPKIATILSTLENIVFCNAAILILPKIVGIVGVWNSLTLAEMCTIIFSLYFVWKYRDHYGYGKKGIATELF
ncbi:MAG: hypothetical protein IJ091_10535 [Oscillospiraceae bacterium]|nr:hypothetical protein [Oscillospiraceae bacterium]